MRALEKVHVKGSFHEHKENRVMVYLQSGRQRFEYKDGQKTTDFDWKEGQVVWSPGGGMHSPEVVSDSPFNIMEVILKKPGTDKAITNPRDPVKIDPKHYKVEFENSQVRAVRVKLGAHESTPVHEHPFNRVNVFLTDGNIKATDISGKVDVAKHPAGDAAWATPNVHKEENLNDKPFEVIMIEVKN